MIWFLVEQTKNRIQWLKEPHELILKWWVCLNWNTLQGPFWIPFLKFLSWNCFPTHSCVSTDWELNRGSPTIESNLIQNRQENLAWQCYLPRNHYTWFSALWAVFQKATQVDHESADQSVYSISRLRWWCCETPWQSLLQFLLVVCFSFLGGREVTSWPVITSLSSNYCLHRKLIYWSLILVNYSWMTSLGACLSCEGFCESKLCRSSSEAGRN